jgi:hypothetical protein
MEKVFEFLKTDWKKYSLITLISSGVSYLVAYNTQDRKDNLVEMDAYNKYVTELVVLNKSPENRLKLAEYFSTVSPSFFSRWQWDNYLEKVRQEKVLFDKNYRQLQDSLIRFEERLSDRNKKDSLSFSEKIHYESVKAAFGRTEEIKNETLQSSTEQVKSHPNISKTIYIQSNGETATLNKAKDLKVKLAELGFPVAGIENMSDDIGQKVTVKGNEIRYFIENDQEIVQRIFGVISPLIGNDVKIIFNPRYAQSKNIEIWLK